MNEQFVGRSFKFHKDDFFFFFGFHKNKIVLSEASLFLIARLFRYIKASIFALDYESASAQPFKKMWFSNKASASILINWKWSF